MARERMRIDLDGVEMKDRNGRVVCLMRFRTTNGLVLHLPESVDVTVPWDLITEAPVDLMSGRVGLKFRADARQQLKWLQDATELIGEWTDRHLLESAPK